MQFDAAQVDRLADLHFRERVIQILSSVEPDASAELRSPSGLHQLDMLMARARSHGLSAELDLGRFIVTAWLLGLDFDTRFPAMREILAEPRLSPTQKMDAIEALTTTALNGLYQGRVR